MFATRLVGFWTLAAALVLGGCSPTAEDGDEPTSQMTAAVTSDNGIWQNGLTTNGIWQNGIWQNGIWQNGIWQNGIWQNGIWQNGIQSEMLKSSTYARQLLQYIYACA